MDVTKLVRLSNITSLDSDCRQSQLDGLQILMARCCYLIKFFNDSRMHVMVLIIRFDSQFADQKLAVIQL